jgi:hypothetical protein
LLALRDMGPRNVLLLLAVLALAACEPDKSLPDPAKPPKPRVLTQV